jgi:hypothetical protein
VTCLKKGYFLMAIVCLLCPFYRLLGTAIVALICPIQRLLGTAIVALICPFQRLLGTAIVGFLHPFNNLVELPLFIHSLLQEANSYKVAVRPERRRQHTQELSAAACVAMEILSR